MATRRERVILELEDNFTSPMARAAAATALLDRNLDSLSGSAVKSQRSVSGLNKGDGLPALGRNSETAGRQIDRLSGRLQLMAQAASVLGPALVPIGAAAVPAIAGMAAQLTVTAAAAGTAALAFQGIGDGLKSLNEYQLEPSAENFEAMRLQMEKLGPAGAHFVRFLDDAAPKLTDLQMTAREGMFPGVEDGITSLMTLLPQVDRIVGNVSEAMGQLAREAGAGLSGEGFAAFFNYLEVNARPLLLDLGRTVGNLTEGLADMLVAFSPLTQDFSTGLLGMSRSFSDWSSTLEDNDSFQGFIDYVSEAGPKVLDLIGSIVDAFVQIVQAAAPIGDVVLPALTQMFDVIAKIADSPLGTMFFTAAAGLSVYNRAATAAAAASTRLGISGTTGLARFNAVASGMKTVGTGVGLAALAMTDLDDKAGLSNTAMLAMAGTLGGPWGVAIGAGAGLALDLADANDKVAAAIERANDAARSDDLAAMMDARNALVSERDDGWGPLGFVPDPKTSEINRSIAELDANMDDVRAGAGDLGDALRGPLVGGLDLTAAEFNAATLSAQEFHDAVASAFGLLDKRASLRAAREAVREFTQTLKDAPNHMQKGSAAFDKVEEALDGIGRSSLEAAEHLRGMDRVRFLDKQRGVFIQAARDMGITAQRARHLADDLGLLDKTKVKPTIDGDVKPLDRKLNQARNWMNDWGREKESSTVDADNKPARGKIDEANKWLDILGHKATHPKIDVSSNASVIAAQTEAILNNIPDEIVQLHTVRSGPGGQGGGSGSGGLAEGGTIPGLRAPYGDKVFSHLAPGEEVISNRFGQADRHRDLLKAINANRYANGGTVTHRWNPPPAASSGARVVERVVERLPGHVTLNAPGMGRMVVEVVDQRIDADRTYQNRLDDRD